MATNTAAAAAAAKGWRKLADRLVDQAAPFISTDGLLGDLLYVEPMLAADRAYRAAAAARARADA